MNLDDIPCIDEDDTRLDNNMTFMEVDNDGQLKPTPQMMSRAVAAASGDEIPVTIDGLGDVIQVGPNLYRKEVTMEKAFEDHLKAWEGPRMSGETAEQAMELEKRRFLMLISARQNGTKKIEEMLKVASTEKHLDEATTAARGLGAKGLDEALGKESASAAFEEMSSAADEVYKQMKADGRVVKLQSGEVVLSKKSGQRMIARSTIARLRNEGKFNIGITRHFEDDAYMAQLRERAMASRAFIEGGLQLPELNEGVNENSSVEVRQKMADAVSAATRSIQEYEREREFITRNDGDHKQMARVNLDDYYATLKKRGIPHARVDELHELNPVRMQGELSVIKEHVREWLVVSETLESAVFVPRLYLLLVKQDSPRVVEFSRVFHVYMAAMVVVQTAVKLPSQKTVDAQFQKFERTFAKEAAKLGAAGNIHDHRSRKQEHWTETHPSKEYVEKMLTRMRRSARRDFLERMSQLAQFYQLEMRYHAGKLDDITKQMHTPIYTAKQVEDLPEIYAIFYYGKVWEFLQDYNMDVLMAYEATLLKMMAKYLPQETTNHWITNRTRPDEKRCSPVTVKLVIEKNEQLSNWRRFGDEPEFAGVDTSRVMAPPLLPAGYDDVRVCNEQPWSPTFAQMRQYHDNMNTLFQLAPGQVEALFKRKRISAGQELDDARGKAEAAREQIQARVAANTKANLTRKQRRRAYNEQQKRKKANTAAADAATTPEQEKK